MTTLVIDRATLPEPVSSLFGTPRIVITQRQGGGEVIFTPVIDPNDFDNDTDYLSAIPGMAEKIIDGGNTPLSECDDVPADWIDRRV
jgi:hypothetical protein